MNGAGREESRGLGPELCFLGNGRQPGVGLWWGGCWRKVKVLELKGRVQWEE